MFSRLFVRIHRGDAARTRIRSGEQEPAKLAFCQHGMADSANRGRNCPECGLPMLYVPPASALCHR